jgi:pantothenate kinase
MSNLLGSGIIRQESIGETINVDQVNKIYLSIIKIFNEFIEESNDIYAERLFKQLKDNKKFDFPINKPMEMFIVKNQKNIRKIIKYIIFRYKF